MDFMRFLPYLLVMAGVTYLIRAVPFTIINKKIREQVHQFFLYYIPYSVLTAMTFPAILYATGNITSAGAGLVVAVFLAFRRKSLLIVAVGACAAVLATELLMAAI